MATFAAALQLIGRRRGWRSRRLAGEVALTRVALSAPPLSRIARRVTSLAALVTTPRARPLLWWPREPEHVPRHDGHLADLSQLRNHPLPPRMKDGGAYDAFRNPVLRMADAALVPGSGVVMPRPGLISAESHQEWRFVHRDIPGLIGFGDPAPRLALPEARPRATIAGAHVSIGHPHVGNYAHWLSDCLAGLVAVLDAVRERRLRIVAPPLAPWQHRSLAMLGVPHAAMTETADAIVPCEDLTWSAASSTLHTHQPSGTMRDVYARLAAAVGPDARADAPRLIQISRERLASDPHRCLNEAALTAALARLGFVALHPERMTIAEQANAFSRAQAVVGLHGAGFANIGFAPPGCLVVDCAAPPRVVPWLFRLTSRLGQRYVLLICEEPHGSPWRVNAGDAPEPPGSFRVAVDRVVETVRAAMASAGIRPGPP